MKDEKHSYPVTRMFKTIPGLTGRMSYSDARAYAQREFPNEKVYLDLVTNTIAILPEVINPLDFLKNFLYYVNDISHHKAVQSILYDAGFVPFIITPNFSFTENKVPEQVLAILRSLAVKAEVTERRTKFKYFEDSHSANMSWVTREEAARMINTRLGSTVINLEDTAQVDKVSTLDLYKAVFNW